VGEELILTAPRDVGEGREGERESGKGWNRRADRVRPLRREEGLKPVPLERWVGPETLEVILDEILASLAVGQDPLIPGPRAGNRISDVPSSP
jgi:hypothetical protein